MDPRIRWTAEHAAREFEVTVLGFNRKDKPKPAFERVQDYAVVRLEQNDQSPLYYFWRLKDLISRPVLIMAVGLAALLFPFLLLGEILLRVALGILRGLRRPFSFLGRGFRRAAQSLGLLWRRLISIQLVALLWNRLRGRESRPVHESSVELSSMRARAYYIVNLLRMQFSPAVSAFWNYIQTMDRPPEVVHCNDLDTLLVGALAKKRYGSRLVYDAHEFYPDCDPHGRWLDRMFFARIEKFLIRKCDGVATVNPLLAELMRRRYGLKEVQSIPNAEPWADKQAVAGFSSPMTKLAGNRVKFLFQGRFTPRRGIEEIIQGWARVDGSKAALFLRGPDNMWRQQYIELARELGMLDRSVFFLDSVTEDLLVSAAAEADVGLIPYLPFTVNDRFACPNKLSQYMHAGLMVVASNLPYVRSVIDDGEVGLIYAPENPTSLAEVVMRIVEDPALLRKCRSNSSSFAREQFNWQASAGRLHALYRGEVPAAA